MPLLPNLVIPGAPKSATTSLCEYLNQHNEVFIPKLKEPRYFIADVIETLPDSDSIKKSLVTTSILTSDEYKNIYKEGKDKKYRCDASVQYLYYHDSVVPKIKTALNDPSIIIVLRNPITRAFSNFTYITTETASSFEEGLALEQERQKMGWNSFWFYKDQGMFYEQVKHYKKEFSKVKVLLMEDFTTNPNVMLKGIFEFLELDPIEVNTQVIYNKSGNPKNKVVEWFFFKDNIIKRTIRPIIKKVYSETDRRRFSRSIKDKLLVKSDTEMNTDTYNRLVNTYRDNILNLQDLIKRDLSHWINTK